jgi:hypothetical protein
MDAPNTLDKGQEGARTLAAGNSGGGAADLATLLAAMAPQATLPGVIEYQADDTDVLGRAAETLNARRRARGRPEGSANKRNTEVFDYLEARGFKAPELRLMEIISADPRELAAALSGIGTMPEHVAFDKVMEVLRLQMKAAEALMPFKFAKRQELNVNHSGGQVHVFMPGRIAEGFEGATKAFSLTGEVVDLAAESQQATGSVGQPIVGQDGQAVEPQAQSGPQPAD